MIYYLYVKEHNITGLKYLGQTQRDPYVYKGSGLYWKQHLKIHGNDISTELIAAFDNIDDLREAGLFYSRVWNVSNSENWANLKEEYADFGGIYSKESRQKMSKSHRGPRPWRKGIPMPKDALEKIAASRRGRKLSQQTKQKISQSNKGRICSEETKQKISVANKGRIPSDLCIQKLIEKNTGRVAWNKGKTGSIPWNKGLIKETHPQLGNGGRKCLRTVP